MKTIDNKIVFSNDIKRILEGKNSLNFDYQKNGIQIPNNIIFENLRKNFQKETKEIFNNQVVDCDITVYKFVSALHLADPLPCL